MPDFDEKVLEKQAKLLLDSANTIIWTWTLSCAALGGIPSFVIVALVGNSSLTGISVTVIIGLSALIGYLLGKAKSLELLVQAHTLLWRIEVLRELRNRNAD